MNHTKESLDITRFISDSINNLTFHHHYYILLDIINQFPEEKLLNYVEIGCYAGASACLVSQRKNTNIISIDLGNPISENTALENFKKLNKNNNNYEYIKGSSHDNNTFERLKNLINNIDVLFIDGDHSTLGVTKDFEIYSPMVNSGGYIIFDDYNDHIHSPEVKPAVDSIVSKLTEYEIIGTLPNIFKARPEDLKEGNCFILKKY